METLRSSFPGAGSTTEGPAVQESQRGQLHLFTFGSPMGRKCQIALETLRELYGDRVNWTWERVPLPKKVQKSDWYMQLNPDGRIPLLVDQDLIDPSTGKPAYLRESGAILLHLVEKFDINHQVDFDTSFERQEMLAWIMFCNSALGPAQAKGNHFCNLRASGQDVPVARELFVSEVHRLYQIFEDRLSGKESGSERDWVAGKGRGRFSLAEIELFPWIYIHAKFGIMTTDEFNARYIHLTRWLERCWARDAVRRGVQGYDAW
ncbi:hypothetical protein ASPZODRAFT_132229 [Penicilliopsis zonata CBS 506.65]|uniref:GST N-terminal domain-containing protein n=1 Tax=Penicilliopsis zonata CBS 506.65 TaxID=1073090 RepID=A0A1L9SJM7_9EURO|nr:hypothetical protein ASPZODRAFT_132229 [Penicilliopsis zonata CBS 506.65]OJJ47254.1 hypothetical protein ASPZODRAFT_132229 [Penicilliopsis zonata CBS 506.65]